MDLFSTLRVELETAVSNRLCLSHRIRTLENIDYLGGTLKCYGIKSGELHVAIYTEPNHRRNLCISCAKRLFADSVEKVLDFLQQPELRSQEDDFMTKKISNYVNSSCTTLAEFRLPAGDSGKVTLFCHATQESEDRIEWQIREFHIPMLLSSGHSTTIPVREWNAFISSEISDARSELEETIRKSVPADVIVDFVWENR